MSALTKGAAVRIAAGHLDENAIAVSALGYASWWLFSAGDRDRNLYLKGSMGLAVSVGFGVALAQPERRVFVFEGDGSILMNLGALATVGAYAPPNLTIVALDDQAYETTGRQLTHTGRAADLVTIARGAGIEAAVRANGAEQLEEALGSSAGPRFIVVPVERDPELPRRYPGMPQVNMQRLRATHTV